MIRRLDRDDAAAWKAFRVEMLSDTPRAFGATLADTLARPVEAFGDWIASAHIFAAEDQGLVASAAWYADDSTITGHRAKLVSVYVRPNHRGRGLMDALLATVFADAKAAGKLQMELDVAVGNDAAIRVYERAGFVRVGVLERALCHDGIYMDEILMLRRLDT